MLEHYQSRVLTVTSDNKHPPSRVAEEALALLKEHRKSIKDGDPNGTSSASAVKQQGSATELDTVVIGARVVVTFDEGLFEGTVQAVVGNSPNQVLHVLYDDGETEEIQYPDPDVKVLGSAGSSVEKGEGKAGEKQLKKSGVGSTSTPQPKVLKLNTSNMNKYKEFQRMFEAHGYTLEHTKVRHCDDAEIVPPG